MILNWETSGNGSGQRGLTINDDGFGLGGETAVGGDDRASFVSTGNEHLLYLWYISEQMGVLNNVLQVLDADVSANGGGRVPRDTQARRKASVEQDEKERQERNAFRVAIGNSLKSITYTTMLAELSKEEECIMTCTLALMEAEDKDDDRKRKLYEDKVNYHKNKAKEFVKELKKMRVTRDE
jgi:hypothetical protein